MDASAYVKDPPQSTHKVITEYHASLHRYRYKVSIDKRSGIINDPNRDDDPQYIVRLIKKIVSVSLKTNDIVNSLPKHV